MIKSKMPDADHPKTVKLKIEELIELQLDEPLLSGTKEFLHYLKNENISFLWTSFNGYDLKYKGKKVGKIYFREKRNRIELNIDTSDWGKYDSFLEGQPKNLIELYEENMNGKCLRCRPNLNCAQGPGADFNVLGKLHKNVCVNSIRIHFLKTGGDMRFMTLKRPNAIIGEPLLARDFPIKTIKDLILARKKYIEKF